jgi:hypothetical protein
LLGAKRPTNTLNLYDEMADCAEMIWTTLV